jgi:hypothetical protein
MSDHREGAEQALADAQRNPILSAEQSFAVAQIRALLAIEQRLSELVDQVRAATAREFLPSEAI